MAYDVELANRLREALADEDGVTEQRMFGGLAFMIGGHMAVAASGQGGLLLRCDPNETDALVQKPHAARFEMRGREMNGWLRIDPEGCTHQARPSPLGLARGGLRKVVAGEGVAGACRRPYPLPLAHSLLHPLIDPHLAGLSIVHHFLLQLPDIAVRIARVCY